MPKFSVIMPTFNHEKFIGMAINSVLMQSEKDLELFHLTDSSDEVLNILNSFHNKENFSPNF